MTEVDYNDGKWHGWNGGECPVHPETAVEFISYCHREKYWRARNCYWDCETNPIIAFRVITPYVEPLTEECTGECWAYHYKNMEPSFASFNVSGECINGKYTAVHVDGKLKSIKWDATDE